MAANNAATSSMLENLSSRLDATVRANQESNPAGTGTTRDGTGIDALQILAMSAARLCSSTGL
jgi:hypothetical protein